MLSAHPAIGQGTVAFGPTKGSHGRVCPPMPENQKGTLLHDVNRYPSTMFWGEERSSLCTSLLWQLCHGTEVLLWFENMCRKELDGGQTLWASPHQPNTGMYCDLLHYTCKNLVSEGPLCWSSSADPKYTEAAGGNIVRKKETGLVGKVVRGKK